MSETPGPTGESADLRTMIEKVEERNSLLVRLAIAVEALDGRVRGLRTQINERPTKESVSHRRRRTVAALVMFGGFVIWGHDQHVEACSPGSQALEILEFAVDRSARGETEPLTPKQLQRVVGDSTPAAACDVSFPLHAHGIHKDSETLSVFGLHFSEWNLVGFLLYGLLGSALYVYQRGPGRGVRHRNSD